MNAGVHFLSEIMTPWQLANFLLGGPQLWEPEDHFTLLHFRPYWWNCDHCEASYDAVLHTETLYEDLSFVSRILDMNGTRKEVTISNQACT